MQGEEIFQNPTRISTIRSRRPEKKQKNHLTLTRKFPWKSCFTTHPHFLSSNPKVLKAFPKTLPTKMKPTKCPAKGKNIRQEKRKKRGGKKAKRKSQVKSRNFAFCACPNFASWYFACESEDHEMYVRPANSFVVRFYKLFIAGKWLENRSTSFKTCFSAKFPRANGEVIHGSLNIDSLICYLIYLVPLYILCLS